VVIVAVGISLSGGLFCLRRPVCGNMVDLRVRFGAPLAGLELPSGACTADRSGARPLCVPQMYMLFHTVLVCPFLFSRLQ
jgi:hypothetical protein